MAIKDSKVLLGEPGEGVAIRGRAEAGKMFDAKVVSVSADQRQRYCVTYRDGGEWKADKPKPKVFHNFFDAIDEGDALDQFWTTRTWKRARKIEVINVEVL